MAVKNATRKNKQKQRARFSRMQSLFADALEMPEEIALDLPRITLLGNQSLEIENHKGIISYSVHEVRLRVSDGYLIARGNGFKLRSISKTEVSLTGEINHLAIVLDAEASDDNTWLSQDDLEKLLQEELAENTSETKPEQTEV